MGALPCAHRPPHSSTRSFHARELFLPGKGTHVGLKVAISGRTVKVEGPKGRLERELHDQVEIRVEADQIQVHPPNQRTGGPLLGLTRTLVANMVDGATKGYERTLDIVGVGFKEEGKGKVINFILGQSHLSRPLKISTRPW